MPPESSVANARAWYRVRYPAVEQPQVRLADGALGRLLDCSESGLRFCLREGHATPTVGARVDGAARLRTAGHQPFGGIVVRVDDGTVALRLDAPGIPLRVLYAEQRALLARFSGGG